MSDDLESEWDEHDEVESEEEAQARVEVCAGMTESDVEEVVGEIYHVIETVELVTKMLRHELKKVGKGDRWHLVCIELKLHLLYQMLVAHAHYVKPRFTREMCENVAYGILDSTIEMELQSIIEGE